MPGDSMPRFSASSQEHLSSCHPDLQVIFRRVIHCFDCIIIEGHRDRRSQNGLLAKGRTQLPFPKSKHNRSPSWAVDVAPYPVDWDDRERFHLFAGVVLGIAQCLYERHEIDHRIRWGGDWDQDNQVADNRFDDLVHFELGTTRPVEEQIA